MTALGIKEFFWEKPKEAPSFSARSAGEHHLSDKVLIRNAQWYVRLRWISIGILALYYCASLLPQRVTFFNGIETKGAWPLRLALFLAVTNTVFFVFSKKRSLGQIVTPFEQLWAQIVIDLIGIAVVVHYCGSIGTPAPFLYVLHIALACIFFPTKTSLLVPVISSVLYCGCIALEISGILQLRTVFAAADGVVPDNLTYGPSVVWQVAPVVVLFFLLWYMVSRLSRIIRLRESQLIRANEETRRVQLEKEKYSVQMTHQLKSPLDAIRSTISLVRYSHSASVSDEVAGLLKRIETRAKGMTGLIIDVLKLSRLNSPATQVAPKAVDLGAVVDESIKELRETMEQRRISVESSIDNQVFTFGVPEHVAMLVENILSNAVVYSYEGGIVTVTCMKEPHGLSPVLTVSDKGIGIPDEKLPMIFDEYFRTKEAITHNSASTGIGLAIVKKVAQTHGIRLKISSELGKGTTITAIFPPPAPGVEYMPSNDTTAAIVAANEKVLSGTF